MFLFNRKNISGIIFFILSNFFNPGFLFINIGTVIFCRNEIKIKRYIFVVISIVLIYILLIFYLRDNTNEIILVLKNIFIEFKLIYSNYFYVKDLTPNFGLLWSLLPEVKYKNNNVRLF